MYNHIPGSSQPQNEVFVDPAGNSVKKRILMPVETT